MHSTFLATTTILTTIFLILSSLSFGLFFLLCGSDGSKRIVMALTVRVILSMGLFIGLLWSVYAGWITPNPPAL